MKNTVFIFLCIVLLVIIKVNFSRSQPQAQNQAQSKASIQKTNSNENVVEVYSDGLEHVAVRDKNGEEKGVFRKPLGEKYRTRNIKFSKNKVTTPDFDSMRDYDKYQDRLEKK